MRAAIQQSIDNSVLCWLATVSEDGIPNVSPKEVFMSFGEDSIIIANIASPQSVANIKRQSAVCVSFVDILVQKGFQLKGKAEIINTRHPDFQLMKEQLLTLIDADFPFASITKITIDSAKPILAPRYVLYPDTCEQTQIENAKKQYGLLGDYRVPRNTTFFRRVSLAKRNAPFSQISLPYNTLFSAIDPRLVFFHCRPPTRCNRYRLLHLTKSENTIKIDFLDGID